MSYDSLVLAEVAKELRDLLTGARVQRVYEIGKNEVLLQLHHRGQQQALLLSCDARHARVHQTFHRYRHPETPSPFCMLLRKYLTGGRVREFRQSPLERVLEIFFDPPEAMQPIKLVAEIMGRRSNLILTDQRDVILGAVKTASWDQNPKRAVQPGEPYRPVPPQDKLNPLTAQPEELSKVLEPLLQQSSKPGPALVQAVVGLSPLAARELLHRSSWNPGAVPQSVHRLSMELHALFQDAAAGKRQPVLAERQNQYAVFPLTHLPASEQRRFESINELLDYYYPTVLKREENDQLRSLLNTRVSHRLSQLEKKLIEQVKELEEAEDAPLYRLYGETLLTYSGQVPRGALSVQLPHLYQPEKTLDIPSNPAVTAKESS
jgi:predicted ribosome quality control (RQC) complex YloA/Tae2 family protein